MDVDSEGGNHGATHEQKGEEDFQDAQSGIPESVSEDVSAGNNGTDGGDELRKQLMLAYNRLRLRIFRQPRKRR